MKQIDYILNNIDIKSFLKDITKGEVGWCENEIRKNVKDYNDIEYQLNYLKFFKGNISKTLNNMNNTYYNSLNAPKIEFLKFFEKKIPNAKIAILKFFEKKIPINKKNIDTYFIKKGIFNLSTWGYDFSNEGWGDEDYGVDDVLKHYIYDGIFFQKIKEFNLIYIGYINFKGVGNDDDQYSIICFHSNTDKKYHLLALFLEGDGNDSYDYVRSFKSKPSIAALENIFKLNKEKLDFLLYWKKKSSINIFEASKNIKLSKYWSKELKPGLNLERKEKKVFKDETLFYKNFKNDEVIKFNFVTKEPEKYFKNQDPLFFLDRHWKENPLQKVKKFKFFNYIMSEKFKYRNDPNFIEKILYSPDDLEGLLNLIPKKIQESKKLSEEIRILKMLRSKDKKFLIKVFKSNKDKLHTLASHYMPKRIFDDPHLVMEMIKIDTNIIDLIGKKLKRNTKFMKKVWK